MVGICLVRRRRPFWGGLALTWAALLRVVPGFLIAALTLKVLLGLAHDRSFRLEPGDIACSTDRRHDAETGAPGNPIRHRVVSRTLIIIGVILVIVGLAWPWLARLGLGRLPGDIVIERENFRFYFPVTTAILISVIISLVFWLLRK